MKSTRKTNGIQLAEDQGNKITKMKLAIEIHLADEPARKIRKVAMMNSTKKSNGIQLAEGQ